MSALYLSKVVPQDSTHSLLKAAQGQSPESEKRVKLIKMAEDSQQTKDDLPPSSSDRHPPGPEDISGAHFPQSMPFQLSKENLHLKRHKCELRRLLKHTNPELKMSDNVVDEELADILSSETDVTAGETGYEGEVLSRRLIFENCALSHKVSPYTPKMQKAEGTVERGDVSKTSVVFERHEEKPCNESYKGIVEDDKTFGLSPDPDRELEEEMKRIDVQATRKIFESQSVNTSSPNPDNKFHAKVSISGDETVKKRKQELEMNAKENLHSKNKSTKRLDLTDPQNKQGPCVHIIDQSTEFSGREEVPVGETVFEGEPMSLPDPEQFGAIVKTSSSLFQNNPFISTNIEREHSFVHTSKSKSPVEDTGAAQDYLIANVKNRAHLFESMPFDKIRHQNKDDVEMMVENIKGTLNSLYHVNAIHSDGSIIEVNETMISKKAKFTLSESGPEIKYDEVAEGGAQNFIVQLLPRANLKPQITYLKEDSKQSMEATVVKVPVHQHQFTTNQDTEFKTAIMVQLVEDILNQDNSLRKGVIVQEDMDGRVEVIVYSLYNYFDEEDVKSYCPSQGAEYDEPEPERGDVSKRDAQEIRKGVIESTISSLLETPKDQACQGSIRPEFTVKGNVKLFKSCIEKGDLENLKTLQAEPTVQEDLPPNQNMAGQGLELHHEQRVDQTQESTTEWVPVDVKRLKNMFSGDQRPIQPKKNAWENLSPSATMQYGGKPQVCNSTVAPQGSYLHLETQDDGRVHQAELAMVVNGNDEISNLQTAIHSLQQATVEAKSLHQSLQEKQNCLVQEPVSVKESDFKHSRTEAELPQEHDDQKEDPCTEPCWDMLSSTSKITSEHNSDHQYKNTETCRKDTNSEVQTTCSKMDQKATEVVQKKQTAMVSAHSPETTAVQQEDEEVVFQGKLKAALDSLGRSNINVSRGDFRAAMIYRNTSKPHKERPHHVDAESAQKPKEELSPVSATKPTQEPLRQEVPKEQETVANAEHPKQSETLTKTAVNAFSEKTRSVGPKPAIPPKPEHLKVNQKDILSSNTKNLEATQTNTVRSEETVPQPMLMTSISCKDEHKQGLFKTGADSESESVDHQRNKLFDQAIQMSQETEVRHQAQGSVVIFEGDNKDKNIIKQQQDTNAPAEEKCLQDLPFKENMNQTDESHVDFNEAFKKFEGKKAFPVKTPPVKPKRVKIANSDNKTPEHMPGDNSSTLAHVAEEPQQTLTGPSCNNPNTCEQTVDNKDEHKKEMKQGHKVEMRGKKRSTETENERRQRLSVHMDEIMRGNIMAAMEIFDNLRKQEELQSILSRVEEIEQDTSEVDVGSLKEVFEKVPDWVVSSGKKKQKKAKVGNKEECLPLTSDKTESKSSMAHVFGDLERASEDIMNLKEQTLARLMNIEEAIKKALYSVSTLKSDSDIAGLSCLFKESLGTEQASQSSGSISKISIGSSRTKSLQTQESPTAQGNSALPVSQSGRLEVAPAREQASRSSSPAFISIQSAARKTDRPKTEMLSPETTICPTCQQSPKTEEKFRTSKTLICNSPAQNRKRDPKRELSILEVQTDHKGNSIMGTKTVTEASTGTAAQPDSKKSRGKRAIRRATYQVTKRPEVQLPINPKP